MIKETISFLHTKTTSFHIVHASMGGAVDDLVIKGREGVALSNNPVSQDYVSPRT